MNKTNRVLHDMQVCCTRFIDLTISLILRDLIWQLVCGFTIKMTLSDLTISLWKDNYEDVEWFYFYDKAMSCK